MKCNRLKHWAFLSLLAVGCGAEGHGDQNESGRSVAAEGASVPVTETVLHELDVAGNQLQVSEFVSDGGSASLRIAETGSVLVPSTLDRLLEEAGPLTTLEIVLALGPEGTVPAASIAGAHPAEARALGREDTSVRHVAFDTAAPIQKYTTAQCTTDIFSTGNTWRRKATLDNAEGDHTTCVWNDCSYRTTGGTIAGLCNDSNADIEAKEKFSESATGWDAISAVTVAAGQKKRYYRASGANRRHGIYGSSDAGKKYHTRAGEMYIRGPV
jgi:hypothetical protein